MFQRFFEAPFERHYNHILRYVYASKSNLPQTRLPQAQGKTQTVANIIINVL